MTFATFGHGIVIVILLILAGGCFFIACMPTDELNDVLNGEDEHEAN